VDLLSLSARGDGRSDFGGVDDGTGDKYFGFHVYRSESVGDRIRGSRIRSSRAELLGERKGLQLLDSNVTVGGSNFYKLEDIETSGNRTMHGLCVWTGTGMGSRMTGRSSTD